MCVHWDIGLVCGCSRRDGIRSAYTGKSQKLFFFYIFRPQRKQKRWRLTYHPLFIVVGSRAAAAVTFLSQSVYVARVCVRVFFFFFVSIKKQMRTVCWMIKRRRYCDGPAAAGTAIRRVARTEVNVIDGYCHREQLTNIRHKLSNPFLFETRKYEKKGYKSKETGFSACYSCRALQLLFSTLSYVLPRAKSEYVFYARGPQFVRMT